MSPLFGHHDDDEPDADVAAMDAEIERVRSLTLPQLAAEIMTKGYGPDGPGGPGKPGTIESPVALTTSDRITSQEIAHVFTSAWRGRNVNQELDLRLSQLIAEGLQVLEHASLVRAEYHENVGAISFVATRHGRAALERGEVERFVAGSAPST